MLFAIPTIHFCLYNRLLSFIEFDHATTSQKASHSPYLSITNLINGPLRIILQHSRQHFLVHLRFFCNKISTLASMCRITFLAHACGHDSSPAPTQCAIYHNYYSSGSVLDLASTLILSAYECPFAQCHERTSSAKCAKCTGGRFNLPFDAACGSRVRNDSNTSSSTSSSSSSSTYSNEETLAILDSAPLLSHKPLPPTPTEIDRKSTRLNSSHWE